jgi:hypothetical protein
MEALLQIYTFFNGQSFELDKSLIEQTCKDIETRH